MAVFSDVVVAGGVWRLRRRPSRSPAQRGHGHHRKRQLQRDPPGSWPHPQSPAPVIRAKEDGEGESPVWVVAENVGLTGRRPETSAVVDQLVKGVRGTSRPGADDEPAAPPLSGRRR
jgi:hypothetical protein